MINNQETILIVDDNPTNLGVLFDSLEAAHYKVRVATNGKTALAGIDQVPPDVVLLDVMMPEMDGFEICRRLKINQHTKDIPVIFMTALSETVDEVKGLQLGAVDYITKPFQVERVLARLETHLALRRLQKDLHKKNSQLQQEITERKQAQRTLQKTNTELQQRVDELAALNHITQTVATATDLQSALKMVAQAMLHLFKASGVGISLLNSERTELTVVADCLEHADDSGGVGVIIPLVAHSPTTQVIKTARIMIVTKTQIEVLPKSVQDFLRVRGVHGLMLCPLLARGETVGIIAVDTNQPDREFTPVEAKLAETIAGQIAGMVENARLFEEEHRQRQMAESLREVATILNRSLNPDTVLAKIMEQLSRVVQYDSSAIFLQEGDHLIISHGANLNQVDVGYQVSLYGQDPAARVFRQKHPLVIADVLTESSWQEWNEGERVRSWLGAPLLIGQKSIGVLTIDHFEVGAYRETDTQILQAFANQAAIAIQNARQVQRTEEALHQVGILYRIGSILAKTVDIQVGIEKALGEYLWTLNLEQGMISLFDPDRQGSELQACYLEGQPQPAGLRINHLSPIEQKIIETGRPLVITDALNDPFMADNREMVMTHNIKSILLTPLLVRGQVIGLLRADALEQPHTFSEREVDLAQAIADQIATTLESARLFNEEQHQRQIAESQNKELDAFAHTVAHDLKTPLGVIIGYADYLAEYSSTIDLVEIQDVSKRIAQAGSKSANIIDELLLLAGVRKQDAPVSALDMANAVMQAQQRLALMIKEYQGEIILPTTWPTALGYGPWIQEVWVNYLSNGLKYGGRPPRLELGATPQANGMIHFWVRDNGPGLAPEAQARLFTEFTRLDKVQTKGYGLGLSIVRRIVEKLGGQVGVDSVVGQGSTFYFSLPGSNDDDL